MSVANGREQPVSANITVVRLGNSCLVVQYTVARGLVVVLSSIASPGKRYEKAHITLHLPLLISTFHSSWIDSSETRPHTTLRLEHDSVIIVMLARRKGNDTHFAGRCSDRRMAVHLRLEGKWTLETSSQ